MYPPCATSCSGADVQNRTGDLVLTKDALCQLSYIGNLFSRQSSVFSRRSVANLRRATVLERETGIEPATNSLEGCDSTTELLPPTRLTCPLVVRRRGGNKPAACRLKLASSLACQPKLARVVQHRAKDGGEGRTRTFEAARATDLQSAAFDRSATSPVVCLGIFDFDAYLGGVVSHASGTTRWSWRR